MEMADVSTDASASAGSAGAKMLKRGGRGDEEPNLNGNEGEAKKKKIDLGETGKNRLIWTNFISNIILQLAYRSFLLPNLETCISPFLLEVRFQPHTNMIWQLTPLLSDGRGQSEMSWRCGT